MSRPADVRRLARALPEVVESESALGFGVVRAGKVKGFCWTWHERVEPKKPRVPNPKVLAVRVPDLGTKDALIASDPTKFFTEPHYNGFPAVLVQLSEVTAPELRELLTEAWACVAPAALVRQHLG